ncbi:hypothetical protein CBER1_01070 [Cercospora berteroae]|uniref:Uncharacterized protein n=1 Tax=Cercospora berteroae TaxID=357750 RepID=A0A2S6C343_9PEZI|nr:hypothetical protein CBER1_01070 [Cercospora berteroae]
MSNTSADQVTPFYAYSLPASTSFREEEEEELVPDEGGTLVTRESQQRAITTASGHITPYHASTPATLATFYATPCSDASSYQQHDYVEDSESDEEELTLDDDMCTDEAFLLDAFEEQDGDLLLEDDNRSTDKDSLVGTFDEQDGDLLLKDDNRSADKDLLLDSFGEQEGDLLPQTSDTTSSQQLPMSANHTLISAGSV